MTIEMTKAHFDNTLETVLAVAVGGIVFCAMWIVFILIDIEASKVSFFSVNPSASPNDGGMDLQLEVSNTKDDNGSGKNQMEVEPASSSPNKPEIRARRGRRVPCQFKMMQIGSVGLLILLTYLLLVASNASGWVTALGALAVFGMFLRFQIGDEIRRQRWDRLTLLVSLFLLIAACLNLSTYAWKALKQGEIYMGPARIIGYDISAYNNTSGNDPTTRTNLVVEWGSDWGCPFTGGKTCEAEVHGVMCAVKPEKDNSLRHHRTQRRRTLVNNDGPGNHSQQQQQQKHGNTTVHGGPVPANGTHAGWGKTTESQEDQKLEKENKDLAKENEELKEEINELKEKNDEEIDEMVDGEEAMEEEMIGEQLEEDVNLINADEEKEEALADVDEIEEEMDKEQIENELGDTDDEDVKNELEKDIDMLDEEENETEKNLDAVLDEDEELKDEYEDYADEEYDEADKQFDAEIDEMFDEEDTNTDLDEIENAIDETEDQLENDEGDASNGEANQQDSAATDEFNWDEMNYVYDDDMYENEYWNYDWDSAWGEYSCDELFDADISGKTQDPSIPAGSDDSWPYINIYGSCKHCDAYIMDYFAEEAFEKLDDYFLQSILFMGLAMAGMGASLIGFIKYKMAPPAENQVELLGSEAGVIA